MDTENAMRKNIIDYIKANDENHKNTNFDEYLLTALVLIKTKIEIEKAKKPSL